MHIKRLFAEDFRRFTKIEIEDIPGTARLVVLAGPNGNGKSSLFDLMLKFHDRHNGHGGWDQNYHTKILDRAIIPPGDRIDIEFHEAERPNNPRKWFYFRSAYRNDPEFGSSNISQQGSALDERRIARTIDNDIAVRTNFQRLYAQSLEDAFEDDENRTLKEFRRKIIGDVQDSLKTILPELTLDSLGNPFKVQTFRFSKGATKGYSYMNLSGGEKAAFDLVLDFTIKKREFDDTIFCIDEPEAHLNPRVHGRMIDALLNLTDAKSQLWIATHSIGMMRRARDLYHQRPGEVAFLDFEIDFDQPQVLRPIVPDRDFWQRSLAIALDDIASLVSPSTIIACESGKKDGSPGEGIDAAIYNQVFGTEYPETRFVSIGSSNDMKGDRFLVVQAVAGLIEGAQVKRLIDRDGMSDAERNEKIGSGYLVLRRRHIESYLFDDTVLEALCVKSGSPEKKDMVLSLKAAAIKAATDNGHPPDHIKAASGRIADVCRRILKLENAGKTTNAFMRDTLAPLVQAGTLIYAELKADIFE